MQKIYYQFKILTLLLGAALAIIFVSTTALQAQKKPCAKPVTLARLKITLQNKTFQTRQIVETINDCGANFQLTPAAESELVAAGARPQVIEAVRNNYRATVPVSNVGNKRGGSNSNNAALTKDGLLKTLRAKNVSNGVLLDRIEKNGVSFETTSAVERELSSAGASPAIITAVKNAYRGGNRASIDENDSTPGSSRYENLIEQAIETYNRDASSNLPPNSAGRLEAIRILNQAAQTQPNNPIAHQQLGFMTLYGTRNGFTASEANFRRAIELGGSSVFRVFHDHDGLFQDTCQGSLYVSRDGVRFEGDDNKHTFDTTDANIKQVKTNNSFRRAFQAKSGSFKIVLNDQSDKDGRKFSFAPLTDNIEESKMVIRLIGK
jgi:hypothetical protein